MGTVQLYFISAVHPYLWSFQRTLSATAHEYKRFLVHVAGPPGETRQFSAHEMQMQLLKRNSNAHLMIKPNTSVH
jgi:hypothetical protein